MKLALLIGTVLLFTSCENFDKNIINSLKTSHSNLDEYNFKIDSVNGVTCFYNHSGKLVNIILTENENINYLYFGDNLSVDSIMNANMITKIGYKHTLSDMNEQKIVIYEDASPDIRLVSQIFHCNMELDFIQSNFILIEKSAFGDYDFFIGRTRPYEFAVFRVGKINDAGDDVLDAEYEMSVESVNKRFYMTIEEDKFEGIAYFAKYNIDSVLTYDQVYFKFPQEPKVEDIKRDLDLIKTIRGSE